jgi:predicted nucleic acid-binding protein
LVLLAKQHRFSLVISEWVVNECIWAAQKKYLDNKIGKQDAYVIINAIADMIEDGLNVGYLESYAISEKVVINSRLLIQEVCVNASDSLHVFIATVSGCDYFVTGDENLVTQVKYRLPRLTSIYVFDDELMKETFQ